MTGQNTKEAKMWKYTISGYYFADDERKYFYEELFATDNSVAMEQVIGKYAWAESLEGKTFKLDVIHYDCW